MRTFRPLLPACALAMVMLSSCGREPRVIRAMYHWSNDADLSDAPKTFLDTHSVEVLFSKVLDIDWNEANHAYPLSITEMPDLVRYTYGIDSARVERLKRIERVPVVYITNRTMEHCDSAQLAVLADKMERKVDQLCPQGWNELQLDCDWSAKTRDNFFALLRMMKERTRKGISATIRLHQYKNPGQTGVPPVDRVMLMMYNVEDVKRADGRNSIFNEEAAAPYFSGAAEYPLPLDIALPAFDWVLHFRNGQFMGIRDAHDLETVMEHGLCTADSAGWYRMLKEDDEYWWADGLHTGDLLRWERMDSTTLHQAVELARTAVNDDTVRVSFFHLQEFQRPAYGYETFEHAWDAFR